MQPKIKTTIRPAARLDLLRLLDWYENVNQAADAAQRLLDAFRDAIAMLELHPEMGAPKMFHNPQLAGLKSWPLPGFPAIRVYYFHSEVALQIVRVLHGKRDIDGLLNDLSTDQ